VDGDVRKRERERKREGEIIYSNIYSKKG